MAKTELMRCSKFGRLCGAFNPHVDLIAELCKVDRLCQKRLSAVLESLSHSATCGSVSAMSVLTDSRHWMRRVYEYMG